MGDSDAAARNQDEAWRGRVGPLSHVEIEEFLAGPQIARVACLDDKGWPYVVPCWQEWGRKRLVGNSPGAVSMGGVSRARAAVCGDGG